MARQARGGYKGSVGHCKAGEAWRVRVGVRSGDLGLGRAGMAGSGG